jgi:hypothetical protein
MGGQANQQMHLLLAIRFGLLTLYLENFEKTYGGSYDETNEIKPAQFQYAEGTAPVQTHNTHPHPGPNSMLSFYVEFGRIWDSLLPTASNRDFLLSQFTK